MICKSCNETIVFNTKRERKFCSDHCRKEFHKKKDQEKRKLSRVKTRRASEDDDEDDFTTIEDPIAYIREHHGGIIDFDAGMLLTFGFPRGYDKVKSRSMKPIMYEYSTKGI